MTIKIGGKSYATRRPKDLDAQLETATGCNADEITQQLRGEPLASTVARALAPFLAADAAPPLAELSQAIAEAGVQEVAAQVADLYDPQGEIEAAPAVAPAPAAPASDKPAK